MKIHQPILTSVEKAVQDGLRKAAREVLKTSNANAPENTGQLKKRGRVNVDDLTVQVSYTGFISVLQHENLDYEHDKGGPKFLENAALDFPLEQTIANVVREALDG